MEPPHHLPWRLLTTHLQYVFAKANDGEQETTDLFPCSAGHYGKDAHTFVQTFVHSINEHSNAERSKYLAKYDPPDQDDILLDDDLVKRISPAIHRLNLRWLYNSTRVDNPKFTGSFFYTPRLCNHGKDDVNCTCPLPYEERKASSFLRPMTDDSGCGQFFDDNVLGFFNLEIVKTLLVTGDMEPSLRTCAHPHNHLQSWSWFASCDCGAGPQDLGWDHVYPQALDAYVCLNVLYRFVELRDHHSDEQDYRRTGCYQRLLRGSAVIGSDAVKSPHIDFFGIGRDQFSQHPRPREGGPFEYLGNGLRDWELEKRYPYGLMPIHDFLEFETVASYSPTLSEVKYVSWMLGEKDLPVEIVSRIMEMADYEPRRRLNVPHDPFHSDNRAELERYLSLCRNVLVRCDMMSKALGKPIDWEENVTMCLVRSLGLKDMEEDSE